MLKRMLLAAGIALSALLFAGCATQPTSTGSTSAPQAALAAAQKFQATVTAACNILMPTIEPLTPFFVTQPVVLTFNTDLGLACAANSVIDLTSINNLIGSSITAAQGIVPQLSGIDSGKQIAIIAAMGVFKGALQNALAQYKASLPITPTSSPAAASTPAAASAPEATQ